MANSRLILLVMFMIRVTTVLNNPLPGTEPTWITRLSDITTSVVEVEDEFGLTSPMTAIWTPVSENEPDDDDTDNDTTSIQTTASSQVVISGVVVDGDVDESKVAILKVRLCSYLTFLFNLHYVHFPPYFH